MTTANDNPHKSRQAPETKKPKSSEEKPDREKYGEKSANKKFSPGEPDDYNAEEFSTD